MQYNSYVVPQSTFRRTRDIVLVPGTPSTIFTLHGTPVQYKLLEYFILHCIPDAREPKRQIDPKQVSASHRGAALAGAACRWYKSAENYIVL
jgi:hypothetical protein